MVGFIIITVWLFGFLSCAMVFSFNNIEPNIVTIPIAIIPPFGLIFTLSYGVKKIIDLCKEGKIEQMLELEIKPKSLEIKPKFNEVKNLFFNE